MSKFNDQYRIESTRLQNWNYAWKGLYFVTVNTKFHQPFLGKIIDDEMFYSRIGCEVLMQWLKTPSKRPDMNITLDEFTVMPNHFHGIIGIGRNEFNAFPDDIQFAQDEYDDIRPDCHPDGCLQGRRDAMHCVSATIGDSASIVNSNIPIGNNPPIFTDAGNKFGPQRKNLSSILRGIKSAVTMQCRIDHLLFDWQPRFHDHLIRNEIELQKIRRYIKNNVKNWKRDRFYKP